LELPPRRQPGRTTTAPLPASAESPTRARRQKKGRAENWITAVRQAPAKRVAAWVFAAGNAAGKKWLPNLGRQTQTSVGLAYISMEKTRDFPLPPSRWSVIALE